MNGFWTIIGIMLICGLLLWGTAQDKDTITEGAGTWLMLAIAKSTVAMSIIWAVIVVAITVGQKHEVTMLNKTYEYLQTMCSNYNFDSPTSNAEFKLKIQLEIGEYNQDLYMMLDLATKAPNFTIYDTELAKYDFDYIVLID